MNWENENPFTPPATSYSQTPSIDIPHCPHCHAECISAEAGPNSNNPGRVFWSCKGTDFNGPCTTAKGFFCWADEVSKLGKRQRTAAPPSPTGLPIHHQRQTHVTKEMVTASRSHQSLSQSELLMKIDEIHKGMAFLTAFITQHLQTPIAEPQ